MTALKQLGKYAPTVIAGSALLASAYAYVNSKDANAKVDKAAKELNATKADASDLDALKDLISGANQDIKQTEADIARAQSIADKNNNDAQTTLNSFITRLEEAKTDLTIIENNIVKLDNTDQTTLALLDVKTRQIQTQVDTIAVQVDLLSTDFSSYKTSNDNALQASIDNFNQYKTGTDQAISAQGVTLSDQQSQITDLTGSVFVKSYNTVYGGTITDTQVLIADYPIAFIAPGNVSNKGTSSGLLIFQQAGVWKIQASGHGITTYTGFKVIFIKDSVGNQ